MLCRECFDSVTQIDRDIIKEVGERPKNSLDLMELYKKENFKSFKDDKSCIFCFEPLEDRKVNQVK